MKGTELYSWREEASGTWFFSLLIGTNRAKTVAEVMAEETRIAGVSALEEKLSMLARGERISWLPRPMGGVPAGQPNPLSFPPAEIIEDIAAHCDSLDIFLRVSDELYHQCVDLLGALKDTGTESSALRIVGQFDELMRQHGRDSLVTRLKQIARDFEVTREDACYVLKRYLTAEEHGQFVTELKISRQ